MTYVYVSDFLSILLPKRQTCLNDWCGGSEGQYLKEPLLLERDTLSGMCVCENEAKTGKVIKDHTGKRPGDLDGGLTTILTPENPGYEGYWPQIRLIRPGRPPFRVRPPQSYVAKGARGSLLGSAKGGKGKGTLD